MTEFGNSIILSTVLKAFIIQINCATTMWKEGIELLDGTSPMDWLLAELGAIARAGATNRPTIPASVLRAGVLNRGVRKLMRIEFWGSKSGNLAWYPRPSHSLD